MPYTTVFPKPLMPIGDVPILDLVLRQLKQAGMREVVISVGHLAELIIAYCGDGSQYGLSITYVREREPLGTIGPLSLIEGLDEPFLVLNGDVLTDLDYGALGAFHQQHRPSATVACFQRPHIVDKAVVSLDDDGRIIGYLEKPTFHHLVAMGLYVFDPSVLAHIAPGQRLDAPDLIPTLMASGKTVQAFEFDGYWLDIGVPTDYQRAMDDFSTVHERIFRRAPDR